MGVSLMTALMIQGNETVTSVTGPNKDGRYTGWVSMLKNGFFHAHLLDTGPAFASGELALMFVDNLVKQVRELDLTSS